MKKQSRANRRTLKHHLDSQWTRSQGAPKERTARIRISDSPKSKKRFRKVVQENEPLDTVGDLFPMLLGIK